MQPQQAPLPPGWIQLVTPDGKIYYQHCKNKTTQWNRPSLPPPPSYVDDSETIPFKHPSEYDGDIQTSPDNIKPLYKFKRQQNIHIESTETKINVAIGQIAVGIAEIAAVALTGAMDPLCIINVAKSISTAVLNLKWNKHAKIQKFQHHELTNNTWIWIRAKYSSKIKETSFSKKYQLKMDGIIIAVQPQNKTAYHTLQSLVTKDVDNTIDKITSILQLENIQSNHAEKQGVKNITNQIKNELDINIYASDSDNDEEEEEDDIIYYSDNINPKCTFCYHLLYCLLSLFVLNILHLIFGFINDGSDHAESFAITNVAFVCVNGFFLCLAVYMVTQRINNNYGLFCICCNQRCFFIIHLCLQLIVWIIYWGFSHYGSLLCYITGGIATILTIFTLIISFPKTKWKFRHKPSNDSARTNPLEYKCCPI